MPVQVNEVIVRTTVDTKGPCLPFGDDGEDAGKGGESDSEIVERVLEILRERRER